MSIVNVGPIFARVYAKLVSPRNTELADLSGREWGALEGAFGTDGKEKSAEALKEGAPMKPIPTFTDTSDQHLTRYVDAYVKHVMKEQSLSVGGSVDDLYYLTSTGKVPRIAGGGGALYLHRLGLITTHHDVNEALKTHIAKAAAAAAEAEAAAAAEAKEAAAKEKAVAAEAKAAQAKAGAKKDDVAPRVGGGRRKKSSFFEGRTPRFDDSGNVCFVDAFDRVYYLDDDAVPFYFDDEFRTFRLDLSTGGVPRRMYVEQVAFSPRNPCHHQHKEWEARFGPTTRLAGGAGAEDGPKAPADETQAPEKEEGPPKAPKIEDAKPKGPAAPPLPEAMMNEDLAAVTKGALTPDQIEVVALRWRTLLLKWLPKFLEQHPELKDTPFGTMLTSWRMKKSS